MSNFCGTFSLQCAYLCFTKLGELNVHVSFFPVRSISVLKTYMYLLSVMFSMVKTKRAKINTYGVTFVQLEQNHYANISNMVTFMCNIVVIERFVTHERTNSIRVAGNQNSSIAQHMFIIPALFQMISKIERNLVTNVCCCSKFKKLYFKRSVENIY